MENKESDRGTVVAQTKTRRPIYLFLWRCGCGKLFHEMRTVRMSVEHAQQWGGYVDSRKARPVETAAGLLRQQPAPLVHCEECHNRVVGCVQEKTRQVHDQIQGLEQTTRETGGGDVNGDRLRAAVATAEARVRLKELEDMETALKGERRVGVLELAHVQFVGWETEETIKRIEDVPGPEIEGDGSGA